MKKKLILSLVAVAAVAVGVVGMSAFEAHVINVTARIENALSVTPDIIEFGTVFPQEQLDREVSIAMSQSFIDEGRADDVEYAIKQKPKCILIEPREGMDKYGRVVHNPDTQEFTCEDPANYEMLPLLCPYLSKHDADPDDQNDGELDAFHGPIMVGPNGWTNQTTSDLAVAGRLAKSQDDMADLWNIDLKVPCFEGHCAQDWNAYVTGINPGADPDMYVQPMEMEHEMFGCDLWIEVTGVSRYEGYTDSLTLENKDENYNWMVEVDDYRATLLYNNAGSEFEYKLTGKVMQPSTAYYLIYYADPWPGNNPGAMIASFTSDSNGMIASEGSVELNMDLPTAPDTNAPGAKLWVVPASDHDGSSSMTTWNTTAYLYEYNLITYNDTDIP